MELDQLARLFDPTVEGMLPEATYAARLVVLSQDCSDSIRAVEVLRRLGAAEAADQSVAGASVAVSSMGSRVRLIELMQ